MDFEAAIPFTGVPAGFLRRKDFGSDFVFGSATSAFQIEGASKKDGRGPCIWDAFAVDDKINLFSPYGEEAVCHYEHYEEDVKIMKEIGFDAYRFSISWSRILPTGKKESRNKKGIDFYRRLLSKLNEHNIEPFMTLSHFDLPQKLEEEYGGFLSRKIADDFCDYADICFKEFGDQVKYWITINEPWSYAFGGYAYDFLAPGKGPVKGTITLFANTKTSNSSLVNQWLAPNEDGGDGSIFPPSRLSFQTSILKQSHDQKGRIGITLLSQRYLPLTDDQKDREAAERATDFMLGWFMCPLVKGEYPENMRKHVTKGHLPDIGDDKNMIQGSFDFLGLNYYTGRYVTHEERNGGNYVTDQRARFHEKRNVIFIGEEKGATGWIYSYPRGILDPLLHIKEKYNNPLIYITENGIDDLDDDSSAAWKSFNDHKRTSYLHDHLSFVLEAKRLGVNVKGYFVWSLLDNFEWNAGFTSRFGVIYVDYDGGAKRSPKLSAAWLKYLLTNK